MSFALTTEQLRTRTKTVTRRRGWASARVGDVVQPVVKGQGLKKGERVERIGGPIRFTSVSRVVLGDISPQDVYREGFPKLTPREFVTLFKQHNGGLARQVVTRIQFEYLEGPAVQEFYETPRWQVEALLRRIGFDVTSTSTPLIVEPAAGNGAIVRPLRAKGYAVWANDLVERDLPLMSRLDATRRETWDELRERTGGIDAVIMNPAFSQAQALLELAVDYAPVVASLLRRTWDEPVEDRATGRDRGAWLDAHPCSGQIVLPRHSYRGTGQDDSATTAWFLWERGPSQLRRPFDVVTKAERDALIERYGAR